MKVLKVAAIVVGSVIALVVVAAIALILLVDPNDYRDDIERYVQQETGRKLTLGGKLDLRLWPWLAIGIENAQLGNPAGFPETPFVSAQSVRVGVRVMPLLSKRIEVSRIAVDGLAVNLLARADGSNNWEDLSKSKADDGSTAKSELRSSIAGVDLTRGALTLRDESDDTTTRVRDLELHTGALDPARPVDVDVRLTLDSGEATGVTHLVLKAKTQWGDPTVQLRDVSIEGDMTSDEEPAGKPTPFSFTTPALTLDRTAETLAQTTLSGKYANVPLTLTMAGEKLFTARVLSGDVTIAQLKLRDVAPSLGIELPQARDPAAFGRFAMKSRYRLTETTLDLGGIDLQLDDTRVRGKLAVPDLDTMPLRFDLDVDAIDADRYMAPEPASGGAGAAAASAAAPAAAAKEPTKIPVEALRELDASGQLRIGKLRLSGLDFSAMKLPVAAQKGLVRLGPTEAQLFGGRYNGNITLDARPAVARLSLDEHVRDIDLGALVRGTFDSKRFTGRGDANAKLSAVGNTDAAWFNSIAGNVDVNVRDGALEGKDLWYEFRRARALFRREAPPEKTGPDRTAFRRLAGSATIANGVVKNDDMSIDLEYLRAKGAGTLTIATQAIDYRLTAEVYKIPAEGAGSEMADLKAVEIPLTITGTIADYKVRPDFDALVKNKVKQKVDEKVEEKKEELKKKLEDKLGDKLKGLFGR